MFSPSETSRTLSPGAGRRAEGFTGVSDPYEPPVNPDLVIESDREPVEFSAAKIISELERRALVPTLLSETPASVTKPLALDRSGISCDL